MTQIRIFTFLLAFVLFSGHSHSAEIRFQKWAGRIDADALIELNEMANQLFPLDPELDLKNEASDPMALFNRQQKQNYRKLEENVVSFVRSKGFYLRTPPRQEYEYLVSSQRMALDIDFLSKELPQLPSMNPYLERIILNQQIDLSEKFLSSATSTKTYKIADSAIAFIPIIGAFYAAKRLQDQSYGPVAQAQANQRQEYQIVQDCAYIETIESENYRSGMVSAETCKMVFPNDNRIQNYREMMDFAFLASLMIKIRIKNQDCLRVPFAFNNRYSDIVQNQILLNFAKHGIGNGWIYSVARDNAIENRYCETTR